MPLFPNEVIQKSMVDLGLILSLVWVDVRGRTKIWLIVYQLLLIEICNIISIYEIVSRLICTFQGVCS